MIFGSSDRDASLHVVYFAPRGPRPVRVENPWRQTVGNVRYVGNYRFMSAALCTKFTQSLGRG